MYLPLPVFLLLVGLFLVSAVGKLFWVGSKEYTDERANLYFWTMAEAAALLIAFIASCLKLAINMP